MTIEDGSRIEFVLVVILWLIVALLLRELGVTRSLSRLIAQKMK